ncbi:MAG: M66 family metalloprotease [Acinetobacter sp.]
MLAACGGGESGTENSTTPVVKTYAEPTQDVADVNTLGYFDYDANSKTRVIRNDLTGSFEAMLQFGQSHVVDPNGNEEKQMPRITTEKDALLLVTPLQEMGNLTQLEAQIYQNGILLRTVKLKDPSQLISADQSNNDERARVTYSKRAWSIELPWNEVKPGLSIRINDIDHKRSGELRAEEIDFAAPGELLVQSIRLGLLTEAPESIGHYMLLEPARAGTDYFQTIPAARMIVSKYDDMNLDKVMVASGMIYDKSTGGSLSKGDVYSGDMRENTAKATFSTGINLANWGITSAALDSQEQPQLTQSVVIHHARGKYSNGEVNHGLSGGNGILTLIDSEGNEFSHEIGHHYGLGHYPGQSGNNYFLSSHHADSGWGYMAFRNRMRGNLNWNVTNLNDRLNGTPLFKNQYIYSTDAMAGGNYSSSLSRYTHYTGYSTKNKIQPAFDREMWDMTSPTGYKLWNKVTRKMEIYQPKVPQFKEIWYDSASGNYLKPRLFGVPIFTILGGYDPVEQKALIYPAARGNWGNVFDLPQATASAEASCWLNVKYVIKAEENIAIAPTRMKANSVNRFNINLAQADQPKSVDLYCKKANEAAVKLFTQNIPFYSEVLAPAVVIGKENGYKALRDVELPLLEQELLNQAANNIIVLSPNGSMLYQSYKSYKNEMSLAAQQVLERYEEQETRWMRLNRWVNVYYDDLAKDVPAAIDALNAFIKQLGLQQDDPLAQSGLLKNNKNCLKTELASNQKMDVYISGPSACTADDTEQWVYDSLGRIHSKAAMGQCLTGNGGSAKVTLTDCVANNAAQVWSMDATTSAIKQSGQCLDLNSGNLVNNRQIAIRYSCSGNNNQRWTMLNQNTSLILAGATSKNMDILVKNLKTQSLN